MSHDVVEKNVSLLMVLIILVISAGGLVEIVPLAANAYAKQGNSEIKPYGALELAGRDIYVREGCFLCHSQMIRPFRSETERYGPYSVAASRNMIIRFSSAPSAPVRIWRESVVVIVMTGIVCTCAIHATWCPNRLCRVTTGWRTARSMASC